LYGADLTQANLLGAAMARADTRAAKQSGTRMPDGSIHA
jgi:uncharacterized protein YjbI with pentapeptide repeats